MDGVGVQELFATNQLYFADPELVAEIRLLELGATK
jgi:hypothetical protein